MAATLMKLVCLVASWLGSAAPVPLIIDTDIGGGGCMDVDDVAAICMAHALVDNEEADLLAIVINTSPAMTAGVVSVLNHYYGRDDLPIGAWQGTGLSANAPFLGYVPDLVNNFPSPIKNTSQVPSAVEVYRKALSQAADRSVSISSIGILTNLADLLRSVPDSHSPLNGVDLVAQKVRMIAVMGGKYPTSVGTSRPECNFCGCAQEQGESAVFAQHASAYFVENVPSNVRVMYSGYEIGVEVQSGGALSSCAPVSNPCRQAYINYEGGPNKSRYSWDPLSTLAVVRGPKAAFCSHCSNCSGTNSLDQNSGNNQWVPGKASRQNYLVLEDATKAGEAIDKLLCQPPKKDR